jgi:PIN domain nuclease of toxin-antitoxin system
MAAKSDRTRREVTTPRKRVPAPARSIREGALPYRVQPLVWRAGERDHDRALLLDTHVWIWTLDGTRGTLSKGARALIERAATAGRVFVSDFSHWEIAMLVSKGRLPLTLSVDDWSERASRAPGLTSAVLTREVLVRSTQLPGTLRGDPADAILLAHAQALGAALVTCDQGLIRYAHATPGIAVCDARA